MPFDGTVGVNEVVWLLRRACDRLQRGWCTGRLYRRPLKRAPEVHRFCAAGSVLCTDDGARAKMAAEREEAALCWIAAELAHRYPGYVYGVNQRGFRSAHEVIAQWNDHLPPTKVSQQLVLDVVRSALARAESWVGVPP